MSSQEAGEDMTFHDLASLLRSQPKWRRERVINMFVAATSAAPEPCAACKSKFEAWLDSLAEKAVFIDETFDEFSPKWLGNTK